MRIPFIAALFVAACATGGYAADESPGSNSGNVTTITVKGNAAPTKIDGDITTGKKIPLEWAANSAVACFPATRFEQFNGNHVFYRTELPARSSITISLTPKNNAKVNLYALRQSAGEQAVPPKITSAISAEASYPVYAKLSEDKKIQKPDDGVRKVDFTSTRSPYSILIGVAGANSMTQGAYTLTIDLKSQ